MTKVKRCPTCHQPLPVGPPARICQVCHKPILRHDKWHFVTVRGITRLQHRHCKNPESYTP